MSDAPVTSLLAVGRDVWVACGKQVHVIRISVRVTSQQTTRLDITVVSVVSIAVTIVMFGAVYCFYGDVSHFCHSDGSCGYVHYCATDTV